MDQKNEGIKKITKIMEGTKICSLATYSEGKIVSRPMGLQEVEFDGDLWFFTYHDSSKVQEIQHHAEVNVSFENNNSWVSLSGHAEEVDGKAKAKELWNPFLKAWFPDGLETEGLTLLKVHADSAEYWNSDSPQVVQLFGLAKAAVTGKPMKGGENNTLNL